MPIDLSTLEEDDQDLRKTIQQGRGYQTMEENDWTAGGTIEEKDQEAGK